jgi:hypothetical protein
MRVTDSDVISAHFFSHLIKLTVLHNDTSVFSEDIAISGTCFLLSNTDIYLMHNVGRAFHYKKCLKIVSGFVNTVNDSRLFYIRSKNTAI